MKKYEARKKLRENIGKGKGKGNGKRQRQNKSAWIMGLIWLKSRQSLRFYFHQLQKK